MRTLKKCHLSTKVDVNRRIKQVRRTISLKEFKLYQYSRAGLRDQFMLQLFNAIHKCQSTEFVLAKAQKDFGNGKIEPPSKTGIYYRMYMKSIADLTFTAVSNDKDLPF